jgi:DNA polymerase-4
VVVVGEDGVLEFIWPMAVEALWGVGPASAARLRKLGVTTVRELAAVPLGAVEAALGHAAGHQLHELAWGRDPRRVEPDRPVKSIGHEETYPTDLFDEAELGRQVTRMADAVASRVRRNGTAARTVTLKVRFGDFTTLTRSHTFSSPQAGGPVLAKAAAALLGSLDVKAGVRLLGVSASGLVPSKAAPGDQLSLDLGPAAPVGEEAAPSGRGEGSWGGRQVTPQQAKGGSGAGGARVTEAGWSKASEAVDAVRARFGDTAVGPAVLLSGGGLRLKRRGDGQWGPGAAPGGARPAEPPGEELER